MRTATNPEQPPLFLSAHVYACERPEGIVFLDLRTLTYFALDASSAPSLRANVADWPRAACSQAGHEHPIPDEVLRSLSARGALTRGGPNHTYASASAIATSFCSPDWSIRRRAGDSVLMMFRVAVVYIRVASALRFRRLSTLLAHLQHIRKDQRAARYLHHRDIQALLTLFAKSRVWFYTSRDACLLDSLVMAFVLRRYGVPAKLHIGAALMPFSAHAWIQIRHCVLDDTVEHVRQFTTLLVA